MTDDMPPTDRNADRERSGRWLSAVLLVGVAGIAVRLVLDFGQPLFTDDIWWHLALGRVFLELGALPHAEPLLFTSQEHVQFYQEWMFELVVAALDRFGGQGLLRATHVIVAAAILFVFDSVFLSVTQSLLRTEALLFPRSERCRGRRAVGQLSRDRSGGVSVPGDLCRSG